MISLTVDPLRTNSPSQVPIYTGPRELGKMANTPFRGKPSLTVMWRNPVRVVAGEVSRHRSSRQMVISMRLIIMCKSIKILCKLANMDD